MNIKNIFASIKTGLINKLTSVYVNGNKQSLVILKELEKEGVIRGFQIVDLKKMKICIFLKYKENITKLLVNLKSVSETKEKMYFNAKKINKVQKALDLFYITTKKGLFTLNKLQALNKQNTPIGGEIKYVISINNRKHNLKELIKK